MRAKFEVCNVSSAVPEILGKSQNLKVGHVTQASLLCDLIFCLFWISTSWSPVELQISTWLDLLLEILTL